MAQQSFLTYHDIRSKAPIASFSYRNKINKKTTQKLLQLCEQHGLSETEQMLKDLGVNFLSYHQLRYLLDETKMRALLMKQLKDGAKISPEGIMERAELFNLIEVKNGQKVIVGTYRDIVRRTLKK